MNRHRNEDQIQNSAADTPTPEQPLIQPTRTVIKYTVEGNAPSDYYH